MINQNDTCHNVLLGQTWYSSPLCVCLVYISRCTHWLFIQNIFLYSIHISQMVDVHSPNNILWLICGWEFTIFDHFEPKHGQNRLKNTVHVLQGMLILNLNKVGMWIWGTCSKCWCTACYSKFDNNRRVHTYIHNIQPYTNL